MSRKKKLEAALESLFVTPEESEQAAANPEAGAPEVAEPGAETPAQPAVMPPESAEPPEAEVTEVAEPEAETPAQPAVTPLEVAEPAAMATPQEEEPYTGPAREEQLVVFTLAGEYYGVDIASVESIIKLQAITAVPRTSVFVEGLTNLRGTVLPVIDLRRRFGLPPREETRETRIVVVELNDLTVGMIVDAVTEVLRVPAGAVEPPSPIVTTVDSTFIRGIAKVDEPGLELAQGRLIILLDLSQVLSTGEQVILREMA